MQTDLENQKSSSADEAEFEFDLYLVEQESHHREIRAALTQLFDEHLPCAYQLRVINVADHPDQAKRAEVLATPTLIKRKPRPVQRVVGDLIVGETLLQELRIFSTEDC